MTKLRLVRPEKSAKFSPPRRRANKDVRAREYLTLAEVRKLRDAARSSGRNGLRDGRLVLMLFLHGLRVAEAVSLTWGEVHFEDGTLLVRRVKNGRESRHFLEGDEIRQLKQLRRESAASRFVFCSERGGPLSSRTVHHIVKKSGAGGWAAFSHSSAHAETFEGVPTCSKVWTRGRFRDISVTATSSRL
jgi:integrase